MSTALAVQHRRLALPESCLFAPTELSIPETLTQNDFSSLGKALSSVDQASDLWACDYALAGQKRWGDEGLKIAALATKLSVGYLKVSARIAERFDPARRFPSLTREHYRGLCCFPVVFTDTWLPTVVEKGFGAKTLRALAVEAFGSDPKACYAKNKKRQVSIPETLFAHLKELSPIPKVAVFIEEILLDFVSNAVPEQKARIAAALLTREEANHQRHRAERNEKIAAKAAARDKIEAEKLAQKEEKQAFYEAEAAQRAAEKEARKAEKIAAREAAKRSKHCDDVALYAESLGKEVRWPTKEEADEVAVKFSAARGYLIESFLCDKCSQWHVQRAVGTCPSDDPASDHAATRPNYTQRRAEQNGTQNINL